MLELGLMPVVTTMEHPIGNGWEQEFPLTPVICCPTTRSLCCSLALFVLIFSGGGGVGSQGGGGGQEPHRWGGHALVRPREMVAHFAELAFLEGCPGGQEPW